MRLTSCTNCFKPVETKNTTIVDGKRVCHTCKSERRREQEWTMPLIKNS